MDLPAAVPSKAVMVAFDHLLTLGPNGQDHGHEGLNVRQHFVSVLMEEIGLHEEVGP